MACCDFFEQPHRDEPAGNGEKDYREHVAAHKLSFGEIIVVVAAVVMLAGMGLVHRDPAPEPRITGSISASGASPASGFTRCDDDNHYLSQRCER
ncbi:MULTISPECIES: hypothetical protein [unclassified Rhizobium]|uniref:hypothetical protein n=1 Tax=unclassified Rhizobium TaxID=2613769 RepID=UPI001ADAF177|nr:MULTISPECIES: hypothetical protein [unclassified Rhizobium]MBO9096571.1 hypothetical protein [Rhizobium sp. L58/93]MBO9136349.1 hypothetical protein [Rhizobium sp. B209b/85]MBO9166827.1 hypothetical protein [Rhizobium sp. L245/93]MBO9182799.1 hypothetical protein [Rhizobium sp. E27B/91]QXZ82700.1 hypothetical protein J5287_11390 [Rhizobium sp. K1/93]